MDTIRNYLDQMFMGLPKSQKVNKAKVELLAMMEDKYHEMKSEGKSENEAIGMVISEFGNLEELSEVLGIQAENQSKEDYYPVDFNLAKEFVDVNKVIWPKIGLGVMLCVIGVSMIFLMLAMHRFGVLKVSEDIAAIIGVTLMFVMIASGVILFVKYPTQLENYKSLYEEKLQLSYEAKQYVSEQRLNNSKRFRSKLALSIAMYVLAVVPVILLGGIFGETNEGIVFIGLLSMFWIIALSTFNIVGAFGEVHSSKVLLQEEEYSIKRKERSKAMNKVDEIYWLVVLVIYLVWSFSTTNWGFTWLIWPIAGILYAIIEAFVGE